MNNSAHQSFMFVKHRIDPKDEARVEALGIDGVYLVEESMRVYPNRELASQTLGFVNMNGDGGAGIEMQYDRLLKGTPGQISFDVDARRRSFRGQVEKPPVARTLAGAEHRPIDSVHRGARAFRRGHRCRSRSWRGDRDGV